MRRAGLAVLLAVPLLAACGGDEEERPRATPTVTERTAPPRTETTPRAEPVPTRTAPPAQAPPSTGGSGGGTPAPSAPRTKPDGPGNDIKPEPGTPESRFEQECDANPADCG